MPEKNLTELNLNNLGLRSLPDILPPCTKLDISDNQLSQFPTLSTDLVTLNLANNQWAELPNKLPPYLKSLNVQNGQLFELPELPNMLEFLHADNNQLHCLPEKLPKSLRLITASNNQITQLPEAIFDLFGDSKIVLKNNPLTEKTYYFAYGYYVPNISVSPSCLTKIEYLPPKPLSEIVKVWLTPEQQKSLESKWLEIEQEPGAKEFSKFLNQLVNVKKSSVRPSPNQFLRECRLKLGGMDSWLYDLVNSYPLRQNAFLNYGHF
ncbi:leucine rich repeat domain-containing protein [Yersinia pseudotuberculosis]|nr:E3 ubiquitin-protein ligase ipaH3 [Yersinia pseudotuberculosis]SUP87553.1 leucine rich repeat domain-containing protein [Yersinia pseudotuberculosis]